MGVNHQPAANCHLAGGCGGAPAGGLEGLSPDKLRRDPACPVCRSIGDRRVA